MRPPASARWLALLLVAAGLAGCAAPQEPPAPTGPIDLQDRLGLFLVDLQARSVTILAERQAIAWMSPEGTFVTFTQDDHAIVIDRATGKRTVGGLTTWAGIHDNGTGLLLGPGRAVYRQLAATTIVNETVVPDAPREGGQWTAADANLTILAAEYPRSTPTSVCANDIYILDDAPEHYLGCHLAVAADGRVGWTNGTSAWVRTPDGAIQGIAPPASEGAVVAHENPVFTANATIYLRLTGLQQLAKTEVIGPEGEPVIVKTGPGRLALHGASADGRLVLLRAFER